MEMNMDKSKNLPHILACIVEVLRFVNGNIQSTDFHLRTVCGRDAFKCMMTMMKIAHECFMT